MTARDSSMVRASALGVSAGLRTFTPGAVLALRGGSGRLRLALPVAAAGELFADKLPGTPSRVGFPQILGRLSAGAAVGRVAGGRRGAFAGSVAALGGAYGGYRARQALVRTTGGLDWPCAVVEDVVAIALAVAATA